MTPPLNQIRVQIEDASSQARKLVQDLDPALLGRRPDQNSWSVAECIAHLSLTADAFLAPIRQAIEDGRSRHLRQSGTSFHRGISARLLEWFLEPPYRLKSRTPAAFVPGVEHPGAVLPEFLDRQQQLLTTLAEADGLALDRLRITSPFARPMRYNVYDAFRLIAVHERRHLWQAGQTLRKLLTPD
jgi:hypothetical protein